MRKINEIGANTKTSNIGGHEVNELTGLFSAFYDRLILRDFFGKIVPGAFVAFPLFVFQPSTINYLWDMSFWLWLFLVGLSWILGFAAQSIGWKAGIIRFYPEIVEQCDWRSMLKNNEWRKDLKVNCCIVKCDNLGENNSTNIMRDFDFVADSKQRQQRERLAVIKEACGNASVALMVGLLVIWLNRLLNWLMSTKLDTLPPIDWMIVTTITLIVISLFLWIMHRLHVDREFRYVIAVLETNKEIIEK
jgi:hypothetical protein